MAGCIRRLPPQWHGSSGSTGRRLHPALGILNFSGAGEAQPNYSYTRGIICRNPIDIRVAFEEASSMPRLREKGFFLHPRGGGQCSRHRTKS